MVGGNKIEMGSSRPAMSSSLLQISSPWNSVLAKFGLKKVTKMRQIQILPQCRQCKCNKSSIRINSRNISLKLFLQVMASIRNVDAKLSEQIKYLTQVSTGQAHEGSSYPSQKVLQTAWHRYAHSPELSVVWQK